MNQKLLNVASVPTDKYLLFLVYTNRPTGLQFLSETEIGIGSVMTNHAVSPDRFLS